MIKGVLFDFWGTLVANGMRSPVKQVLFLLRIRDTFHEFIVKFEDALYTKTFDDQAVAFESVCKAFNVNPHPVLIEKLIGMWNKNKFTAKPYDDTIAYLKTLKEKGIKVGLVCNTDNFSLPFVLDKFEMRELFDEVVLSCDVGALKTNPALYEHALEKLGLQKEEVLIVGDSEQSDMQGATNANIKGVLMDRRNSREYTPKVVTLEELNKFIE
jgi:HAD superfamily hydrolase (TIGR01493 family)